MTDINVVLVNKLIRTQFPQWAELPIAPWQNGYAERLLGSIRRQCLDHVVVGERQLRRVLASYQKYANEVRTHLSLQKDAPVRRDICRTGRYVRRRSWAGYTIDMFEFEFPTATILSISSSLGFRRGQRRCKSQSLAHSRHVLQT
jgi:hypothetical protein